MLIYLKKFISLFICIAIICLSFNVVTFADDSKNEFWQQVSEMINKYEEDDYFSVMSVKIGTSEIDIDGEIIPIDESNSVPYVENGRTMMPVRGLAEAIGADVSFDDEKQTVTVETEETMVLMTIGSDEMEVNGESVALLNAPQIVNDRTMLPVRDVAEALDCEVEWVQETETAVFTRPLQTKRVIAFSEDVKDADAVMSVSGEGMTIMQFASIDDTKDAIETLKSKGITAEPDYVRKTHAMSWGIADIGSKEYYNETDYASGSAVVAVVDTGVDLSHSYFKGKLVDGYDFYDNDSSPQDLQGHGTHVASTVLDVAGFNTNIKIMPIKVFGTGDSTYSSTIAQGIEYAADHGADVINLSLGGQHYSAYEQEAIDYAHRKNVAVVAAAGNEKLNLAHWEYSPGGLNHVITVSALTENGSLASFSNYGEGIVEFAAPGVNIKGAKLGGGYCTMGGTSMASPHVAGAYAIVKAVHPEASIEKITEALGKNARDKGNSSYFGYGYIKVNALEKHISHVFCDDEQIENIKDNSAILSGTIRYEGIIPEYVGARLGTSKNNQTDVVKVRFSDMGNKTMNFRCELNSLKSGTKYYVCIFMKPGGLDYVSENIEFTTTGIPTQPEPVPDPSKSELRIIPEKYPTGDIKEGSSYGLSGRIKSNYHITEVRSYLLDSNYSILQESLGWTTTQTYVIEDSKLDTGLQFNKLGAGTYYLRYYAEDETGNSATWTSDAFRVVAEAKQPDPEPDPVISELRILPDKYPSGELTQGNKFGLSGRIKSNCHITDVRSYLLDSNKNVIMEASGWTTTQTYVIENSALDKGMKFDQLSAGTYYLKYVASDESGNTVSWTSDPFTVAGNVSKSELRILPDKYPTGTLTKGKSFNLSGRIKSDYHITDVRAYMLDSNKSVIMEASGWTTTQTYVIEGSALDKGMKFNNLSAGGYYLKYVASDESGNTVSWTSDMFYVK